MLMPLSGHRGMAILARAASAASRAGWSRVARQVWVVGATLALLTVIGAGLTIWDMHRRTLQEATDDARTLGIVLAAQTTRYVEVIDLLLREVQAHTLQLGIHTREDFRDRLADEATLRYMEARLQNLPQAHALFLDDADGNLLNTSRNISPRPHISVADRDFFQYARDHADGGLFVSVPDISRASGLMTVFLSRRISAPDGSFLGVIVAGVDVDYLVDAARPVRRHRPPRPTWAILRAATRQCWWSRTMPAFAWPLPGNWRRWGTRGARRCTRRRRWRSSRMAMMSACCSPTW